MPDKYNGGEIIRVTHDRQNPYVVIQRSLAQDSRLTYQARGLLLYLLSKPDDWQAQMGDLQREGQLGRFALRSILHELEAQGYLVRQRTHTAAGRWEWISHIYENPADAPSVNNRPMADSPMDSPPTDNRPINVVESARTIESQSIEERAPATLNGSTRNPSVSRRAIAAHKIQSDQLDSVGTDQSQSQNTTNQNKENGSGRNLPNEQAALEGALRYSKQNVAAGVAAWKAAGCPPWQPWLQHRT